MLEKYKGELIKFTTNDDVVLTGFLMNPGSSSKCVIYVHGMAGNFYDSPLTYELAKQIVKKGFAFFAINTRGHDIISSIRKFTKSKKYKFTGGTTFEKFEDCKIDIDSAIKMLKTIGFEKFVLSVHSTGCQKVIYYQFKKANKKVIKIILLAPCDDYNIAKKDRLSENAFNNVVKKCKELVSKKQGNLVIKALDNLSAKRFLSIADLKNIEARLFNYDGPLIEFSKIKIPVFALFGDKEQNAVKPVEEYMNILKERKKYGRFYFRIIKGGNHSFYNREKETAKVIGKWLKL